ncbi:hypothetical protein [Aeromonas enteropelogenes]|uniref:hypothetical protein n=1 Tax=Aeromonas enteropelogenes TaxID=29489 RepID=UPI003BA316B0
MTTYQKELADKYISRADDALQELVICRFNLDEMGAHAEAKMLQKAVSTLEHQLIRLRSDDDIPDSELEQLLALMEGGQLPIDINFTDPVAARVYLMYAELLRNACINGRQVMTAEHYINTALNEMSNGRSGHDQLKKCLEDMNAQGKGKATAVVLCSEYNENLNDYREAAAMLMPILSAAADTVEANAVSIRSALMNAQFADDADNAVQGMVCVFRDTVALLECFSESSSPVPIPQQTKVAHMLNTAPVGSERFFDAIEALLGTVSKIEFCAGGYIVELEHWCKPLVRGQSDGSDEFSMSIEGVQVLESSVPLGLFDGSSKPQLLAQHLSFMDELKLQVGRMLRSFEEDMKEGAQ